MDKKLKTLIIVNYIILGLILIFDVFATIYFFNTNKTENVFEDNILKVVEIKVSDDQITWGHATGFFVDNNGKILTNRHVAVNSNTNLNYEFIYVRTANVEEYTRAEVVSISEDDDLAILKADLKITDYFKIAEFVTNGETIFTIGNPNGFGLSISQGLISSNSRNVIYNEKTINTIQTSLVINEGSSGGPVFNSRGYVVGIISFRLKDKNNEVVQGCSFAVPCKKIIEFLNISRTY